MTRRGPARPGERTLSPNFLKVPVSALWLRRGKGLADGIAPDYRIVDYPATDYESQFWTKSRIGDLGSEIGVRGVRKTAR